MKKPKIVWFARGGGIAKMGPFKSQVEATNALRLRADPSSRETRLFPDDAFVWPEEA